VENDRYLRQRQQVELFNPQLFGWHKLTKILRVPHGTFLELRNTIFKISTTFSAQPVPTVDHILRTPPAALTAALK
jgi:hypothetical protein